VATAAGESAVAIVRISGPEAIRIVAPLLRSAESLQQARSHQTRRVTLVDPRSRLPIDEALCTVMQAPRSYTGEDTVELSCHGSPALVRLVLERLLEEGARLADPGEFTRRAFLNGRIDLAQAEAVALMISARSERGVALAARGIGGELSRRLHDLRARLLDVVASLEVTLDFPDDAPEANQRENNINKIAEIHDASQRLLSSAHLGFRAHLGLTLAIVGPPNAGKSSLFNAILGRERAIVTPEAGTTRDVVEGSIVIAGVPIRILDTAGLGEPRDRIDAEGMRRAQDAMHEGDLLLVVLDGSAPLDREALHVLEQTQGRERLVVLSKRDLGSHSHRASLHGAIRTSVKTEGGLQELNARLIEEVKVRAGSDGDEGGLVASLRQLELLKALTRAIVDSRASFASQPAEIALVDLREALEAISMLLGLEVGDSVLDTVFAKFCVGK
jgi:tRNA modification GTPase